MIKYFLEQNFWIGIETISTITIFIISAIVFLKQRKELIYQQTTMELRNEVMTFLHCLKDCRHFPRISPENAKGYFTFYEKIKKHNNQSLINEFCLHNITRLILIKLHYNTNNRTFHDSEDIWASGDHGLLKSVSQSDVMAIQDIRNTLLGIIKSDF